ncbi:helix-turn-helix transcriptional regulator [Paraburkholderia aspalathi]|nr:helix-turn-helix transcriptional regulator [Paraburkholderia aspalathi]MBK3780237.1 helix-turn-helix transcriptional regulator [Paraburkholderia aspalathi]
MLTTFGQTVRLLRIERGLLLKNMADALKLSSAQLSAIEVGRSPLSKEIGEKTVEYFRATLDADGLEKLQGVVAYTLELSDGGNRTQCRAASYGLSLESRSPAELVAAFAGQLQGRQNRECK